MGWVKPWFNIWTDLRKLAEGVRGSRVSYCGTTKAGPVCDLRGHLESISGPKSTVQNKFLILRADMMLLEGESLGLLENYFGM